MPSASAQTKFVAAQVVSVRTVNGVVLLKPGVNVPTVCVP